MKRKKKQNSLLVLFILTLLFFSCKKNVNQLSIFSSIEKYDTENVYSDNLPEYTFLINSKISSAKFHSGKYSVVLDSINQFALNFKINLKAKTNYSFSFWKDDNKDNLFFVVTCGKEYYKASNFIIDEDKSGWAKVECNFIIPDSLDGKEFKCYIWNNSKQTVYVDDIELKTKKFDDITDILKRINQVNDTNTLILTITEEDYFKLLEQRDKAIKQGILKSDIPIWIKSTIIYKDSLINAKIRLKGDWLDHLNGISWSFRVNIKDNNYYKGMKVFSLQKSDLLFHLNQWLLYKVAKDEDLLAPRYGYVKVYLNELFLGVYAYQEHFTKQMIESQKRREGPIVKIDEETYWDILYKNITDKKYYKNPFYEAAKINNFLSKSEIDLLYEKILIAHNLLYQHKNNLSNPNNLINIDLFARYYALIDLFIGYHGLAWHNQRFYYNPIISKLEPIFFDNFPSQGPARISDSIYGDFDVITVMNEDKINKYIFFDSNFISKYVYYLKKYSSDDFIDSVLKSNKDEIQKNEDFIKKDYQFSKYCFDSQMIYNQAKKIRNNLPKYLSSIPKITKQKLNKTEIFKDNYNVDTFFIKNYVYGYTQNKKGNISLIKIINFYPKNLYLVGYINKNKFFGLTPVKIPSYLFNEDNYCFESVSQKATKLVVTDSVNIFTIDLLPWSEPTAWSPRQELENSNKFPNEHYYKVDGKNVFFSGKQKISSIIYIPDGYNVIFEPGTEIDFVNNGAFMCWSKVQMNGTAQKPIVIKSTDKTAKGFTILQAPNVTISYTTFDGLDSWKYKGWELTGATTIYESRVKIDHCNFINNVCEDDLNIVRSYFEVTNSLFSNTFGDAFDSDFCDGLVDNCVFSYLGNDAIDFSTSKIKISNCKILNANDKGVSGGEGSTLTIENCDINGANIGIASKDKSLLTLLNINISNTNYGFVLLQKKPEYGPGKIVANNIRFKKINKELLIEEKSVVILNNKRIDGFERRLAEKFY